MNNKKIISIVVLLCFLGIAIFTFSNFKKSKIDTKLATDGVGIASTTTMDLAEKTAPISDSNSNSQHASVSNFSVESPQKNNSRDAINPKTFGDTIDITFTDGHKTSLLNPDGEWLANINQVDINFDGLQDIERVVTTGAYNVSTEYFIQDEKTRTFYPYPIPTQKSQSPKNQSTQVVEGDLLTGLALTRLDVGSRTLVSFFKGRGIGDMYTEQTFSFKDGAWVLTKDVRQDVYERQGSKLSDETSGFYIRTTVDYSINPTSTKNIYLKYIEQPDHSFKEVEVAKPF